jgi:hypothetical protein
VARERVEVGLPLFGHVFDGSLVLLRGCDERLYPAALLLRHGDQRFDPAVVRDDARGEGVHDPCEPVDFFFCRQSSLFGKCNVRDRFGPGSRAAMSALFRKR